MYLVQLAGAPIAAYTGGVNGIAATKPAPGAKLDTKAWNYGAYREYLRAKRAEVLGKAKIDKKKTVAEYDTVLNGVAAKLTGAEVAKLRAHARASSSVWKNEIFKLDTISTPRFLGLDGADGAWNAAVRRRVARRRGHHRRRHRLRHLAGEPQLRGAARAAARRRRDRGQVVRRLRARRRASEDRSPATTS